MARGQEGMKDHGARHPSLRNSVVAAGLLLAAPAGVLLATPAGAEEEVTATGSVVEAGTGQVGRVVDGRIEAAPGALSAPLKTAVPAMPEPAAIPQPVALPAVAPPAVGPPAVEPPAASPDAPASEGETATEPAPRPLTFAEMRAAAPALKADTVCGIIRNAAVANELPPAFLARLIWKESRFDTKAVSPVGALGIAQFMPGTAKLEGLDNPFDPLKAIHASAKHLADMRAEFGNLGLAAIGYNAGRERARKFMRGDDWLPRETVNYVASILGRDASDYADGSTYPVAPLKEGLAFSQACLKLPVIRTRAATVAALRPAASMPWHVQISRHFARHVAVNMFKRAQRRHRSILGQLGHIVVVERGRPGMIPQKSVRVGAKSRAEAQKLCARLKRAGGFCLVKRNRRG